MHAVEGGYERSEPPLLLHWLRDSTLSLPLVFTFVWLGLVATRHLVERRGQAQCGPGLAVLTCAAVSALAASFATAIGVPLHAGLFSAHHAGHELGFAEHMARDGLVALAASLPISLLVTSALARRIPWAAPEPRTWRLPVSLSGRVILRTALGLVLAAPVAIFAATSVQPATAALTPGEVCPDDARREALRRPRDRRRHPAQPLRRPRPAGQDVRARRPGRRRPRAGALAARSRSACATTPSSRSSSAPTSATASRSRSATTPPAATTACTSTGSPSPPAPRVTRSATTRPRPSRTAPRARTATTCRRTSSSRAPTTCAPGRATARPSHTASSARWPSSRRARRTST